jgi:Ca2+-dependent lipid-binding protein
MAEIAKPRTRLEGEYAGALLDFLIVDLSTAEDGDSLREAVVKLEALTSGLEKAEEIDVQRKQLSADQQGLKVLGFTAPSEATVAALSRLEPYFHQP